MKHFLLTIIVALAALTVTAQGNRICIEDFVIDRDSIVSVPVVLANETPMRGLQFNMTLPDGLKVESSSLTKYSEKYEMNLVCRRTDNGDQVVFIYPMARICYPAGNEVVVVINFAAGPDFKGGEITLWKCFGSTIDNVAFPVQGGTTTVTVPSSSLIQVPADSQPVNQQYFNLMGHPLKSPDCAPVAIVVTTTANGQWSSRKVAIGH